MPLVSTNAFCFDLYNHDLCCAQHHAALKELVLDIAAQAVGLHSGAWSFSHERGVTSHTEAQIELGLPTSFGGKKQKTSPIIRFGHCM